MKSLIVAENAGFCMGVKRAVDMVIELAKKSKKQIYTYGPLIHNPQVIELLKQKGVTVVDKNKLPKKGIIVIRTHGIEPSVNKKFMEYGLTVFDATCPFVKKVQNIIQEYSGKGYKIIIIGDKGHAEVDSYLGYAKDMGVVISGTKELAEIDARGKICIVAQTTQDRKIFNEIVKKIKQKNPETKVFDTVCNATSKRQEEALKISRVADAMIVVGGKNSANTRRLVDICKSTGAATFFIEKAKDLRVEELAKYKKIGITAGASTSKNTIQEVINCINANFNAGIPEGTAFQQKVWKEIAQIPCGETKTYKEIAKAIGSPHAYRAVGQACNKNPIPIVIPCHRVVSSDGSLGGYSRGIEAKKLLLDMEKAGRK